MAEIIGQEAKALGVNQLFAPVVDLARELRFGRVSLSPCTDTMGGIDEHKGRRNIHRRPLSRW